MHLCSKQSYPFVSLSLIGLNIFMCRLVECCDGALYWSNRLEVDFIEIGYGVENILKATQKLCGFLQTESLSYCIGKITINLVN